MLARGMVAKPKAVTVVAAPAPAPTVQVLVAARDLAPGERIGKGMLKWMDWPVGGLNPAYISKGAGPAPSPDPKTKIAQDVQKKAGAVTTALLGDNAMEALNDSVIRMPFTAGEPIVATKLVRPTDSGVMAVSLAAGMRAMSIPLSPESGAAGFIQPGDHVDVVQTRKVEVEGQPPQWTASTVMKNVRVIAIDAATKPDAKAAVTPGTTATLEVSPEQAEAIVLSRVQGELTLVLRSYADASGPTVEGAVHRAAAEQVPVVRVFRPGQIEQVKVAR